MKRRRASLKALLVVALTVALGGTPIPTALAAAPRASFTQIEGDVMCVACHESLAVAQSPEAYSERQYIRTLIAQGETRKQIENNLVAQYGPSVLALPPARGFDILVYVIPPLVLILGLGVLVITVPRWRRRARAAAAEPRHTSATLDAADARRLEEDLARQA